jgi:hypothetical protein
MRNQQSPKSKVKRPATSFTPYRSFVLNDEKKPVVSKKWEPFTWDTTLADLGIPKIYPTLNETAKCCTLKLWVEKGLDYKLHSVNGFRMTILMVNYVDRIIYVITERELQLLGGQENRYRKIAEGLDKRYRQKLHYLINQYTFITFLLNI